MIFLSGSWSVGSFLRVISIGGSFPLGAGSYCWRVGSRQCRGSDFVTSNHFNLEVNKVFIQFSHQDRRPPIKSREGSVKGRYSTAPLFLTSYFQRAKLRTSNLSSANNYFS